MYVSIVLKFMVIGTGSGSDFVRSRLKIFFQVLPSDLSTHPLFHLDQFIFLIVIDSLEI